MTSPTLPHFIAPAYPTATLAEAICAANDCAAQMETAEKAVRDNARRHLLLSLGLGGILRHIIQTVGSKPGAKYTSLFADKPADAYTAELAGGVRFSITYATGNKYKKLYDDACRRLKEIGMQGMAPAEVDSVLAEHTKRLMCGGYADAADETESIFGAIISAGTMRQAMLELAPAEEIDRSMAGLRNALAEQREEALTPEQRREKANAAWASVPKVFSTFLDLHARFMTRTERESAAAELRAMAASLLDQPANLLEAR